MLDWQGKVNGAETAEIATAKRISFVGFKTAIAGGVPKQKAGDLVDEQFGTLISHDAWRAQSKRHEEAVAQIAPGWCEFDNACAKAKEECSTVTRISG
jgi:3-keto-L-gulonate-6-phosphate decarboxylase